MKFIVHVAAPPPKPLMIYDGDCNFCALWIRRWLRTAGGRVECLPYQDSQAVARFPEIPGEEFRSAVQLILPDGAVFSAAEAVFRALAFDPHKKWLLDGYRHSPVFARVSECGYRFVARHRRMFSMLTRLLWGRHLKPPSRAYPRSG